MRHSRARKTASIASFAFLLASLPLTEGRREVETDATLVLDDEPSAIVPEQPAEHKAPWASQAAADTKVTAVAAAPLAAAAPVDAASAALLEVSRSAGKAGLAARLIALTSAALRRLELRPAPGLRLECWEDSYGERVGCKAGSCSCEWFERCYPKVQQDKTHRDVGVCGPGLSLLVFLSLVIIGSILSVVVMLRSLFQWRDRIRSLMSKDLPYEDDEYNDGQYPPEEGHQRPGRTARDIDEAATDDAAGLEAASDHPTMVETTGTNVPAPETAGAHAATPDTAGTHAATPDTAGATSESAGATADQAEQRVA